MYFYEVAPTKIVKQDSNTFTYHYEEKIPAGTIVSIPVGKKTLVGVVIHETGEPKYETKPISSLIASKPLPSALLKTVLWMSEYYAAHLALVLQTVLPAGMTKKRRTQKITTTSQLRDRTNFVLNEDQSRALSNLLTISSGTAILHGVTGSGKTAVYIEYAKKCIKKGKSVLVLVPEIALTSQLITEFQSSFPNLIATHSRQTEAQRHVAWLRALTATEPLVAIGPRSTLFLPLENIGAIIIDEAHEPALKQDQTPRYSALRVAAMLAHFNSGIVIQGSATPLVSEYYTASKTNHPIIELPRPARSNNVAPRVTIVDMTKRSNFTQHRFFSNTLIEQITANLASHSQTLLYHNRRGSASSTLCKQCGWMAMCPKCYIPLTLHIDRHILMCHVCGHKERVPTACPVCKSTDIIHKGIGTKLIEYEVQKLFPKAKVARFDGDTTESDGLDRRYTEVYDGSIDIIIGTQVVAKGLDLPHLSTVGVVQADAGLALPDFMTRERTFQLLAQVIGRVGRDSRETSVIVQSYQPKNEVIVDGVNQNYAHFYKNEIEQRKLGKFPPFVYLLKLTCIYKTEATAIRNSQKFAQEIRTRYPDVSLSGPMPAFYERARDTYRWQIVLKSTDRTKLLSILSQLPATHWQYDIDPANLL